MLLLLCTIGAVVLWRVLNGYQQAPLGAVVGVWQPIIGRWRIGVCRGCMYLGDRENQQTPRILYTSTVIRQQHHVYSSLYLAVLRASTAERKLFHSYAVLLFLL